MASLCEDLHLHFRAGPEWIMKGGQSSERFFELQIFSIGPLTGYVPQPSMSVAQDQDGMGDHGVERQELLNVSAAFTVSDSFFGPRSVMSLEGVYNPEDGRMHLVGCQGVEAPWKIMSKMRGLRSGMDSSIELEVQYPPTRMRWLFSPSAKVHLSSTRATGDPLYFNRTELLEHPSYYAREMSNRFMEQKGVVCLAMPSATIAAAFRQLRYMESHPDTVPYISLGMLGVQALGYGTALVTDASILLAWPRTFDGDDNYRMQVRGFALGHGLLRESSRPPPHAAPGAQGAAGAGAGAARARTRPERHGQAAPCRSPVRPRRALAPGHGQGESYSRPSYNMAAMVERCIGLVADYIPEDTVTTDLAAPAVEKVFDAG
ncbi:hypothetical protein TRIUR3_02398 [Triticum urartu]|uniref:RING-type E3 ubiquitin transferase n=2 Tax=Triticum urartu TaxID=4572 RepID=M8ACI3_TRIUA|nr:hypothetical protein TRIUR3_02398 [Triticum urartu]